MYSANLLFSLLWFMGYNNNNNNNNRCQTFNLGCRLELPPFKFKRAWVVAVKYTYQVRKVFIVQRAKYTWKVQGKVLNELSIPVRFRGRCSMS